MTTIYTVQHKGQTFDVEGPDNATPEQLQSFLAGQGAATPATAAAPASDEPQTGLGKVLRTVGRANSALKGLADSGIQSYIGLKQVNDNLTPGGILKKALGFGSDSSQDQAVLREMNQDIKDDPHSTSRTLGNVAGKILQTAVPVSKLGAIGAGSPIISNAAISGGLGALLNPGEGETTEEQLASKGKQAGEDAAWGGVFGAAGKVLSKALGGLVKPSVEAKRLLDEGIVPTVSQGAESKSGRFLGSLTSGIYDVSRRQNEEVVRAYLKRIAPNLDTSSMTVQEINGTLKKVLNDEFDTLFSGKKFQLTPSVRKVLWKAAGGDKGTQTAATEMGLEAMGGSGDAMLASNNVRMGSKKMLEYRNMLQNLIDDFSNTTVTERQAKKNLIKVKSLYDDLVRDSQLSQAEKEGLKSLNERYTDFLRFKEASTAEFQRKPNVNALQKAFEKADPEGFALGNTTSSQRELLDPAARVMGLVPRQDEARAALAAGKRAAGPVGKTLKGAAMVAFAPVTALSMLSQTRGGARYMFGDLAGQAELADLLKKITAAGAGAGYQMNNEGDQ